MNKPKLGLAVALYLAALMLADLLSPLAGVQGRIAPLVFCLIVFFSFAWFVPARAWRPLLMAIAATSAALAALALAQIGTYPRPQSIFGSPNILAGYACLHVFLALFLASQARWPWLWYGVAGLNAAAVGAAAVRAAITEAVAHRETFAAHVDQARNREEVRGDAGFIKLDRSGGVGGTRDDALGAHNDAA